MSKFCQNCGTQLTDDAVFCTNCGSSVSAPNSQAYQPQNNQPNYGYNPMVNQMPMKWFKFLIYFLLWASGVVNLVNGFQMITGAHYDGGAKLVYAYFDGLKAIDLILGILSILLAGIAIYTRFRLAGFHANGPKMIITLYTLSIIMNVVYCVAVMAIAGDALNAVGGADSIISSTVGSVAVSIAMVFANKTYFQKRANMFTNP